MTACDVELLHHTNDMIVPQCSSSYHLDHRSCLLLLTRVAVYRVDKV
jgi:hypothetical protein